MPQNWLFLARYQSQRRNLLTHVQWNLLARLGPGAFETISGEVVQVILATYTNCHASKDFRLVGIDASALKTPLDKSSFLKKGNLVSIKQSDQAKNPDHRITLEELAHTELLGSVANGWQGIASSDSPRFVAYFWEVPTRERGWVFHQSTVEKSDYYAGRQHILLWEDGCGCMTEVCQEGASFRGKSAWNKKGVACSQMSTLHVTLYEGTKFDNNTCILSPYNPSHLAALWCFAESEEFRRQVRLIDQKMNVTNSTLTKIPFDLDIWQRIAEERYPNGLPGPYSDDPTQWLFHGHPYPSVAPLQVAVARLAGYCWPAETDTSIELSEESHKWISLDKVLAEQGDAVGIVCLPSVRGEPTAHARLGKLLAIAFEDDWSSAKERELLLAAAVSNNARRPEVNLETWLRNSFFAEHCKLFQGRPFVWQVWDGNPTGFAALVNAHKLTASNGQGRKTLELLTFTYLGDWIDRQRLDQAEGANGADDRLAAALDLQDQLKKILDGEPPYDIFVRWKPLHKQAIGWDPDINDGVRLNIRPFLNAQLRKGGKAGAGILRAKPGTIKWSKDRGKEPMPSKDEFPWFWGWDENDHTLATDFGAPISGAPPAGDSFDGNRWNDLHYSRAAKEAARARHRGDKA
jgi:hypothetical protein